MKAIILSIIAILFVSCGIEVDSIHNHKGEVIVRKEGEATRVYSYVVTRVSTKNGYKFRKFRAYNSELGSLTVNDTIK